MPIHQMILFAKAIADPTRARILAMLGDDKICVCEIADVLAIPQSTLSTHLQSLRQAGIVRVSKRGTWAYYSLVTTAKPVMAELQTHFGLAHDSSIQEDRARLKVRLAMRECNCCVKGSGQLIQLGGQS